MKVLRIPQLLMEVLRLHQHLFFLAVQGFQAQFLQVLRVLMFFQISQIPQHLPLPRRCRVQDLGVECRC
jgi:hypothetical protein